MVGQQHRVQPVVRANIRATKENHRATIAVRSAKDSSHGWRVVDLPKTNAHLHATMVILLASAHVRHVQKHNHALVDILAHTIRAREKHKTRRKGVMSIARQEHT